jgi:hypothetical protein
MAHQEAVTVQAPVRAGETEALKQLLVSLASEEVRRQQLPLEQLPVHFARFVVLDEARDLEGSPISGQLVFLSDVDAPAPSYLRRLAAVAGGALDQIFGHCVGYPSAPTGAQREEYLHAHLIPSAAIYINTVGRTLEQVRLEAAVHDHIEAFLDGRDWKGRTAGEIHRAVRDDIAARPEFRSALKPARTGSLLWRLRNGAHLVASIAVVVVLGPVLIFVIPVWLVAVRVHEQRDVPITPPPEAAHEAELAANEGVLVQNQLSAVGLVKPGALRQWTLRAVLWGLNFASRHVYNAGQLAGIRTIHFARWTFLDDRRRLIFASNYDGSLESYMDDFIDKVSWGLNAAFSNGRGYPKTRWLLFGGAQDEQAFKNYLRNQQIPTQLWYSAYGDLTAVNLANNAAIRAGLQATMTDEQVEQWAARL